MSSLLQADIFFFITSVAVIIFSLIGAAILIVVFKIFRKIQSITTTIDDEVQLVKQDIDDLRGGVRDRLETASRSPLTSILGAAISQLRNVMPKKKKPTRRRTTRTKKED